MPALRSGLVTCVSMSLLAVGCSGKVGSGALLVLVELEPGLQSRCVKVVATDSVQMLETTPIVLAGKQSPLRVGISGEAVVQPFQVQAVGFGDEGCTQPSGELSESAEGSFSNPVATVTVTLRAAAPTDGGADAGEDAGTDAGTDGGTDAGVDAGVDADNDGYPAGVDCDDNNPAINPGAAEACGNGVDDDCDTLIDCADRPACDGLACTGGGTCVAGGCLALTEVRCDDGIDNNGNGLIDCADPACVVGTACSDNDVCTLGDRCVADGGCEKTGDFACTTPPGQCFAPVGTCQADGGASCSYAARTGSCDDGLLCTTADTCGGGVCSGTPVSCPAQTNVCRSANSCAPATGLCQSTPLPTGACDDGQNCTINDTCDGDGGCAGTPVSCTPPSQCHQASGACTDAGTCLFNPRTGQGCDAGTGAGTCSASFTCDPVPSTGFPYVPSNFTEAQLPATDGGVAFTVSCNATLNTGGTPALSSGCGLVLPPLLVFTQSGGSEAVLLAMDSFQVNSGSTLSVTGSRPLIIAVRGNATVAGSVLARNGAVVAACGVGTDGDGSGSGNGTSGGGGGGFGGAGAAGGTSGGGNAAAGGAANGGSDLKPLRAGCRGGTGTAAGGAGGGAVQLSASGTLTVSGVVSAPGRGGTGGSSGGDGGGGGGSGGGVLLEGATVALTGTARVTANGGGGGEGSGGGGGNNGADGSQGTGFQALGGFGGSSSGGNGGLGGAAIGGASVGVSVGNNIGGGGGGGGVGRIRVNASTSCTVSGTAVVSPAATSNGASGCP